MKFTTIEKKLRYERKYLVPFRQLGNLRERIIPFVKADQFGEITDDPLPQYTVRSIYLDTHNLDCHGEKLDGVNLRKKFRIRTYNFQTPESMVAYEIKKKIENRIQKYRARTKYTDIQPLMQNCEIHRYFNPRQGEKNILSARRFFYHYKKENMRPTVLVSYEREAYFGLFDPGVRITFDKNIRSMVYPSYSQLFKDEGLKHLFPSHFILEIKYFTHEMPTWLRSVVQDFRLRKDALSKYTIGYDVHFKTHIFNF